MTGGIVLSGTNKSQLQVTVNSIVAESVAAVLRRFAAYLQPQLTRWFGSHDYGSIDLFVLTIVSSADSLKENVEKATRLKQFARYKNPWGDGWIRSCTVTAAIEPSRIDYLPDQKVFRLLLEAAIANAGLLSFEKKGFDGSRFKADLLDALSSINESNGSG